MHEFYSWNSYMRLFITFLFAVCMLVQSLSVVLAGYRLQKNRAKLLSIAIEVSILLVVFCMSLLHGQAHHAYDMGFFTKAGYVSMRVGIFIVFAFFAILNSCDKQKVWLISYICMGICLLPTIETISGKVFSWLFVVNLVVIFVRGILMCFKNYKAIKSVLSFLSIKSAVDNLNTGILFCHTDGQILLVSKKMQNLIALIAGKSVRNGKNFYENLINNAFESKCELSELEGQSVCLLKDGSVWMFTKSELIIRRKLFIQLTATNVTKRYSLTDELKKRNQELTQKGDALRETIANLHIISRDIETQKN